MQPFALTVVPQPRFNRGGNGRRQSVRTWCGNGGLVATSPAVRARCREIRKQLLASGRTPYDWTLGGQPPRVTWTRFLSYLHSHTLAANVEWSKIPVKRNFSLSGSHSMSSSAPHTHSSALSLSSNGQYGQPSMVVRRYLHAHIGFGQ